MIHLYITSCENLEDPKENTKVREGLPAFRVDKMLRYRTKKKRIQSLGASILLQKVLEIYGRTWDEIFYGENGKPQIEGFYFNLSHSEDMVICAVSDTGNIGCDIEKIKEAPLKVADRHFCKTECMHLYNLPEEQRDEEFYRIWTLKESYMKMTGDGIKLGLDKFYFTFDEIVKAHQNGTSCECYIKEYMIPGYKIAVCAEDKDIKNRIEYMKIS